MLKADTNHQHVDLEIGYSQGWWRVNGGVRAVHYLMSAGHNTPFFAGYDQREMYGLGPKIGAGALLPFSEPWSLIGQRRRGYGDETYNKMLATRRAAALQDELRRQGLDSRQIDNINITF
jgi:hypothetical protein